MDHFFPGCFPLLGMMRTQTMGIQIWQWAISSPNSLVWLKPRTQSCRFIRKHMHYPTSDMSVVAILAVNNANSQHLFSVSSVICRTKSQAISQQEKPHLSAIYKSFTIVALSNPPLFWSFYWKSFAVSSSFCNTLRPTAPSMVFNCEDMKKFSINHLITWNFRDTLISRISGLDRFLIDFGFGFGLTTVWDWLSSPIGK